VVIHYCGQYRKTGSISTSNGLL